MRRRLRVGEDRFTNTEADAGRYERWRAADDEPDGDRPSRAEAEADEQYLTRGEA